MRIRSRVMIVALGGLLTAFAAYAQQPDPEDDADEGQEVEVAIDRSQLPPGDSPITTIVAVDLDRDVDLDFVLGGPERPVRWLENLRHGELRYRDLPAETKFANAAQLAVIEADAKQRAEG